MADEVELVPWGIEFGETEEKTSPLNITVTPTKGVEPGAPEPVPVPSTSFSFTPIKLGENRIEDTYQEWGKMAPVVIANEIVDQITGQKGAENLMTLESLLDGTAPYFDLKEETKNLSPEERKLNHSDIVREFSDAEDRNFMQALFLESPRIASGLLGAKTGAELGAKVTGRLLRVPGAGYAALGATPALTIAGALFGSEAGPLLRDYAVGPPNPYTPESRLNVIASSAVGDAIEGFGGLKLLARSIGKKGRADLGLDGVLMMKGIQDIATDPNVPRSFKFVRGLEDILGKIAQTAYLKPKETALAEAGLGVLGTAGAVAAEKIFPGDPLARAGFQTGAPVAAVATYALSPSRILLSKVGEVFDSEKAIANQIEMETLKYQNALERNPELKPEDFNLQVNEDGSFSLIDQPKFLERTINIFKSFGEGRKKKGAQFLIDDYVDNIRRSVSDPAEADKLIKEGIEKIISDFSSGDTKQLFTNPSFARVRRMLERQGIDFSAQAKDAREAGETALDAEMEANIVSGLFEAGIVSNTRDGYLMAALLAQKNFEAGLAEKITEKAGKVFAAFKQVKGEDFNSLDAAKALYDAIDPIIDATSRTATNLYKGFKNHRILFDQDTPTLVKLFDQYADEDILPRSKSVRSLLPAELKVAVQTVEDLRADHADFAAGLPPINSLVRQDVKLNKAQQKLDDLLAKGESGSTGRFNDFMSEVDLTSENAPEQINAIIKRQYEGRSASKGAAAKRTKNLLEAQRDVILEEKAAIQRAQNYAKDNAVEPLGIDTQELKELRSELLDYARRPTTEGLNRKRAYALADVFEKQLIDEKVARDVSGEEAEQILSDRAVANAYYNARKNIFNDGIFAAISKRSGQGSDQSVEILREKMSTLGAPTAGFIEDLQRAVRFAEDPIGTPSLRPGALAATDAVDLTPYEKTIREKIIPPSTDAAEHQILTLVENLIAANQKTAGIKRQVVDPTQTTDVLEESKDLGITSAERTAIQTVLDQAKNNGLDLLPNLKQRLQTLLDEGKSYATFNNSRAKNRKKFEDQNLWFAMSEGGRLADFTEIMKEAFGAKVKKQYGIKPVFDKLMTPIRQMNAQGRKDPKGLLESLKQQGLFSDLKDVNIANLSEEAASNLVEKASDAAKAGLRGLILDYAKAAAGKNTNAGMNYTQFRDILLQADPSKYGMPALVDWMRQNRLMDADQINNLRNSLDKFVSLEAEIAKDYPDLLQSVNPVKKAFVSILGSGIGSATHRMLQRFTGGLLGDSGTLVASGAGAEAARNVLINARAGAVQDGLIALMMDKPEQIARYFRLAQKGLDPKAIITEGDGRNFLNILMQMQAVNLPRGVGIRLAEEQPLTESKPYMPEEGSRTQKILDPRGRKTRPSTPPQTRPSPSTPTGSYYPAPLAPGGMGAPRPQPEVKPYYGAPAAPGGMGAATSTVDRARFAAAFPEDRELLGIGSLMG